MHARSDAQLLREYAQNGTETAFAEIVLRHTNLVYSCALRQVGSPEVAAEIAQEVFFALARNAGALSSNLAECASLAGWLCRAARNHSLNHRRDEFRRHARERKAMEILKVAPETAVDWEHLRLVLDDAMSALGEADYDAVVMRFYLNEDLRAVGLALGVNDDTAQKRVSRALDKLREVLRRRGITTSAGALSVVLASNAVQAAPAGLAATISTAALAGTAAGATTTLATTTKVIAMTTLQKAIVAATLAVVAGAGIYEAHQATQLRDTVQELRQQQAPMAARIQQLQQERDDASNRLAADNQRLSPASQADELLRLRSEVTRLRDAQNSAAGTNDTQEALLKSWLQREARLKQLAAQTDKSIPEFQLLSEKQWLDAAMDASLDTDTDVSNVLARLRNTAENNFAAMTEHALQDYAKTNNGSFPSDVSQLQPYFSSPVSADVLDRWQIAPRAVVPNVNVGGDWIVTQKPPFDPGSNTRFAVGPGGYGSSDIPGVSSDIADATTALQPAIKAYSSANNGQLPTSPLQIQPYLSTPEQQAAFQTFLQKVPNNPATGKPW